jgi:hypothetical protein
VYSANVHRAVVQNTRLPDEVDKLCWAIDEAWDETPPQQFLFGDSCEANYREMLKRSSGVVSPEDLDSLKQLGQE